MPAEWEPHTATWLAWPHYEKHWPGKLEKIPFVYAEIIRALKDGEKVYVCVNNAKMEDAARDVLKIAGVNFTDDQVNFFIIPTDASWARDHGPIFVKDDAGNLIITDWVYNAWGGKWPHRNDDIVPQKIGKIFNYPVIEPGMVLEGGSIDVNGQGTMLTTKQCLLNQNRNPNLDQRGIEKYLSDYLGVKNFIWLEEGIVGDDTDGHIDDVARFVDVGTILCALADDLTDENYACLKKNYESLQIVRDQDGKKFKIITLPMPGPIYINDARMAASYLNFYIANDVVLMPRYNCPQDVTALKILKDVFSDRKVVAIDCVDLIWGFGAIHCSTQQQPL